MPAYTKTTQELAELKKQQEAAMSQDMQSRAQQGQLSQEEQEQMGKQILNNWGFVSKDDVPDLLGEQIEGYMVARDAVSFSQQVEQDGKPKVTPEELIREMERTGNSMEEAYMGMFPSQLEAWENSKVTENRDTGFYTQTEGQSARSPEPTKVTADNIDELAQKALNNEL